MTRPLGDAFSWRAASHRQVADTARTGSELTTQTTREDEELEATGVDAMMGRLYHSDRGTIGLRRSHRDKDDKTTDK